ncbi:MAG: DUF4276 family protein [Candidatus Sumerlaeota bacterium]|nr:DUF4276 family protein [Candidatus Sumerlaeota bacterium]
MRLEFLVEEPSAEEALSILVPRIAGPNTDFGIHAFGGKRDLLKQLPDRLRGYKRWLPNDWRIVVLVDEDRQDCRRLKRQMERACRDAGLGSKSNPLPGGRTHIVNRLAIEELEAWFFGDLEAVRSAYPRVPPYLESKAHYRDPDAIKGGTWEALERVLQRAGYHPGGLVKKRAARDIASHMDPERNRSRSFRLFRDTLRDLARV